jgi:DNA polymerase alpha subunit A
VQEQMRNGQIELEKYIITKSLTKAPEDYPDAKNQPHVQVRFTCFFISFGLGL